MDKLFYKKIGFTLAEVLITLAVIGVVAAISIPSLQNAISDMQYKTAYKKAFAVAQQTWYKMAADNLIVYRSSWGDNISNNQNFNTFKSFFNVTKDCSSSDNSNCWSTQGDSVYGGCPNSAALAFIDNSGMAWSRTGGTEGFGFEILLDTNGLKSPNQYGRDRFILTTLNDDGTNGLGLPVKLRPASDYPKDPTRCPSVDYCYYTSWLK